MPKMKTKSGAKKRFKMTGTGKVKAGQAERFEDRISASREPLANRHFGTVPDRFRGEPLLRIRSATHVRLPGRFADFITSQASRAGAPAASQS